MIAPRPRYDWHEVRVYSILKYYLLPAKSESDVRLAQEVEFGLLTQVCCSVHCPVP